MEKKISHNKPVHKSDTCVIIRHVKGMYDAFFGEGWVEWVRFKAHIDLKTNKKYVTQVAGTPLSKFQKVYLSKVL